VNADIWLALNVTATTAACGSFADGLFIGTGGSYGGLYGILVLVWGTAAAGILRQRR
jgi:hypothetical protein